MKYLPIMIANLIITIGLITGYHYYLIKKGVFAPSVKGIYTVNVKEAIQAIKKDVLMKSVKGQEVDAEKVVQQIQNALNKLRKNTPDGYILLPESIVLGGKHKKIDLITGKIEVVDRNSISKTTISKEMVTESK